MRSKKDPLFILRTNIQSKCDPSNIIRSECGKNLYILLLVPQNIVMDMSNVMLAIYVRCRISHRRRHNVGDRFIKCCLKLKAKHVIRSSVFSLIDQALFFFFFCFFKLHYLLELVESTI